MTLRLPATPVLVRIGMLSPDRAAPRCDALAKVLRRIVVRPQLRRRPTTAWSRPAVFGDELVESFDLRPAERPVVDMSAIEPSGRASVTAALDSPNIAMTAP